MSVHTFHATRPKPELGYRDHEILGDYCHLLDQLLEEEKEKAGCLALAFLVS